MNTSLYSDKQILIEFHAPVNQYNEELQGKGISLQETSHPTSTFEIKALKSQNPLDKAQVISG